MQELLNKFYIKGVDIRKYKLECQIGKGGFGDVFKVQYIDTKTTYAAKVIRAKNVTEKFQINVEREANISSKANHPCVIQFHGFSSEDFEGNRNPVIITEYEEFGSLGDFVDGKKKGPPNNNVTAQYIIIYGIATGMSYLHSNGVLHRDLKENNILLDLNFFPLIADFGLAKFIDPDNPNAYSTANDAVMYSAPEVFDKIYNKKSEVYSYGIILLRVLTGKYPYENLRGIKGCLGLFNNENHPKIPQNCSLPAEMKELIEKCWSLNPDERPSFDEIIQILEDENLIEKMGVDKERFYSYKQAIEGSPHSFNKNSNLFVPYEKLNQTAIGLVDGFDQFPGNYPEIMKKAIEGNSECIFLAGRNFINGEDGFPRNEEYGISFLKLAHTLASSEASLMLAEHYINNANYTEAADILSGLLNRYPKANLLMAKIVLIKKEKNYIKDAKYYLENAASSSNSEAILLLGELCFKNANHPGHFDESFNYFNTLSIRENSVALAYRALICLNGHRNRKVDFFEAREMSRLSHEQGNLTGTAIYAECLVKGFGLKRVNNMSDTELKKILQNDIETGINLAKISSKSNNRGRNLLGLLYNQGIGSLEQNRVESARLWKLSSESGDAEGKFLYGAFLIEHGDEFQPKNDNVFKGIRLIQESMNDGCLTAKAYYGFLVIQKRFVDVIFKDKPPSENDMVLAVANIEFAANCGDNFAITILAMMLSSPYMYNLEKAIEYLEFGINKRIDDCRIMYMQLVNQGQIHPNSTILSKANKMEKINRIIEGISIGSIGLFSKAWISVSEKISKVTHKK